MIEPDKIPDFIQVQINKLKEEKEKQKNMSKAKLKNNICFILDASGSMSSLKKRLVEVFNKQIANLIDKSQKTEQETRVSVFTFANEVKNICWDTDCLRSPNIESFYYPSGATALIRGVLVALDDIAKIPEIHGDYSNLFIVLSDGENNLDNHRANELKRRLENLPDNSTVIYLAPDARAKQYALSYGFHEGNIKIWNATEDGIQEASDTLVDATNAFIQNRSKGIRSTKSLFSIKTENLSKSIVKNTLEPLNGNEYDILLVRKYDDGKQIRDFVVSWQQSYRPGSGYYQLTKKELIQANKNLLIKDKKTGKVYGGPEIRKILGLPDTDVKVDAASHPNYLIFVQSNAVNRKLVQNTELIVLK